MLYHVSVEFNKDVLEVNGNQITIGVKSKPVDGKANNEIIRKLAKQFDTSSANIVIRSGRHSRQKIVEIT